MFIIQKFGNNSPFFATAMTTLAPFFLASQWLVVVSAIAFIVRKSDWRQHIPFFTGLLLLHLVVGIAPAYFLVVGPKTILGYPYYLMFGKASTIYLLGVLTFVVGYLLKLILANPKIDLESEPIIQTYPEHSTSKTLLVLLFLCWAGVLLNFHASGVHLLEVLNPANRTPAAMLFSIPIYNGFLESLANSLIAILLLLYAFSQRKAWVLVLIVFHLLFFFLAGWRYRIVLTLLGLAIYYLPSLQLRSIWKWAISLSAAFVLLLWVSQNRMAFSKRMFHLVTLSVADYDVFRVMHEVGSCRTFMATLLHIETNNIAPDRGASFYLPILWRFQPSENFPGGVRPKPPLLELEKAWIPKDVKQNLNPGVCNLEEYYLLLGWPGLVLIMALFGFALHLVPKQRSTPFQTGAQMIYSAFLFQFISRGYLPQQLKLLVFLSLPLFVLFVLNKLKTHIFTSKPFHEHQA